MEKLYFIKDTYYLTQGYKNNTYSHAGRKALDISAKSGGNYKIYAPFSGYVAKVYVKKNAAYTIWLVSNDKILCADGNKYYAVMMITHPSEIANFKVGDKFKSGDHILNDGKTGNATGLHVDLEIAIYDKKNDIKPSWYKNSRGTWGLINAINPCDYIIMKDNALVINEKYNNEIYHFKRESEVKEKSYEIGLYMTKYNMYVRSGPGIEYTPKKVRQLTIDGKKNATSKNLNSNAIYKKGTKLDVLEIINNNDGRIWARGYSGYVCIRDNNTEYLTKL